MAKSKTNSLPNIYIYIYINTPNQPSRKEHNTTPPIKKRGAPPRCTQGQDKPAQHRNQRSPGVHINIYGNFRRIRETIQRASKYNSDPFGNVINLSNFKFCIPVYKLLGKNRGI